MQREYYTTLQFFGENIIGFTITAKNYRRKYSMVLPEDMGGQKELETTEEFISRNTTDFLDDIKNLPKAKYLTKL